MFCRKYKNQINELLLEEQKQNFIISDLKRENRKLKEKLENINEIFKNYDYAILVDKNEDCCKQVKFWNNGRFENDLKELHFDKVGMDIFEITIVK